VDRALIEEVEAYLIAEAAGSNARHYEMANLLRQALDSDTNTQPAREDNDERDFPAHRV
jgi:hypothetical protein